MHRSRNTAHARLPFEHVFWCLFIRSGNGGNHGFLTITRDTCITRVVEQSASSCCACQYYVTIAICDVDIRGIPTPRASF